MQINANEQPTPRSPEWLAGWDAGRAQVGRLASVVTRQRSEIDISRGKVDYLAASLIQQGSRVERQQAYCDKLRAELDSARFFAAGWKRAATKHKHIWGQIDVMKLAWERDGLDGIMGTTTAELRATMFSYIAGVMAGWFVDTNGKDGEGGIAPAPNYRETQMELTRTPIGPLVFTIQRQNGKTPHELRLRAEAERDALAARVAELTEVVKSLLSYRDTNGALNFQLEKADDFLNQLRTVLYAEASQ